MSMEEQKGERQDPNYGTRGGRKPGETPAGDGGLVGATDVTPGAGGYGGDRSGAPGGAPARTGGNASTLEDPTSPDSSGD